MAYEPIKGMNMNATWSSAQRGSAYITHEFLSSDGTVLHSQIAGAQTVHVRVIWQRWWHIFLISMVCFHAPVLSWEYVRLTDNLAFHPPNCPINGSAFPGIERTADYMIRVIHRLQTDCLRSVSVRPEAQRDFNKWVQSQMSSMVWSDSCNSWCMFYCPTSISIC